MLTRGDHTPLADLPKNKRATALDYAPKARVTAPRSSRPACSTSSACAFNELWFRKAPVSQVGHPESLAAFFHPLDMIGGWNRIYGRSGFLQYQFVVPFGQEQVMREIVTELVSHQCPSFLAVLKRFGAGNGLLSFPVPGWTLALDIPAAMGGPGPLLSGLDERVVEAGGRVYLAKASRLAAAMVPQMYPELDRWREIRERLDPHRRMASDLAGASS